jgi:hypothetical protein
MSSAVSEKSAHSPRIVEEFCKLCDWSFQVWLNHRELFDDNPRAAELQQSMAAHALTRLRNISHEYVRTRLPSYTICIGILNHLFFWPEQYRRTGGMSIVFLFDENPDIASAGLGGAAVGDARSVPDHAARSNSERAAPSARVGNRFSAPQIVCNKSNRCAGEHGGARVGRPRWMRILMISFGSCETPFPILGRKSAKSALI